MLKYIVSAVEDKVRKYCDKSNINSFGNLYSIYGLNTVDSKVKKKY